MIYLEEYRVATGTFVTKLFSNAIFNMCCVVVNFVKFTGVVSLTLNN